MYTMCININTTARLHAHTHLHTHTCKYCIQINRRYVMAQNGAKVRWYTAIECKCGNMLNVYIYTITYVCLCVCFFYVFCVGATATCRYICHDHCSSAMISFIFQLQIWLMLNKNWECQA